MDSTPMLALGTAALGRPQYINIRQEGRAFQDLETFKDKGRNLLEQAYRSGIRYFDTAPGYGMAEQLVLEWLQTKADTSLQVATKWGYTYVANFDTNAQVHGKFVYAYADFYPQKDYYLASVADSIFLNPVGKMDFKGLSTEVLYFKDFQEKTGIKMEVVRHGKYKSAVEPFLSNEMSSENRIQIRELLGSLWNSMDVGFTE